MLTALWCSNRKCFRLRMPRIQACTAESKSNSNVVTSEERYPNRIFRNEEWRTDSVYLKRQICISVSLQFLLEFVCSCTIASPLLFTTIEINMRIIPRTDLSHDNLPSNNIGKSTRVLYNNSINKSINKFLFYSFRIFHQMIYIIWKIHLSNFVCFIIEFIVIIKGSLLTLMVSNLENFANNVKLRKRRQIRISDHYQYR